METSSANVIVVEDDDDLRESVAELLTHSGFRVTAVADGRSFYRALDTGRYAAAVIDVGLPDQSGLVLAAYLRDNTSTGIILLTARDSEEDQVKGYETGADLYLCKPVAGRVLVSAIRRLTERLRPDRNVAAPSSPGWTLQRERWLLTRPDGRELSLTAPEISFLECLAASEGREAGRDRLTSRLYQRDDEYSGRALDALVRRLRKKMDCVPEKSNPIKSVYGVGFCFAEPLAVV